MAGKAHRRNEMRGGVVGWGMGWENDCSAFARAHFAEEVDKKLKLSHKFTL